MTFDCGRRPGSYLLCMCKEDIKGYMEMGCWTPLTLAPFSAVKREGLTGFGDPREIVFSSKLSHPPPPTSNGGPGVHFQGFLFLILFQEASLQLSHCVEIYS